MLDTVAFVELGKELIYCGVCWSLRVLVAGEFLDPLPHIPSVVPLKVFLNALFVLRPF